MKRNLLLILMVLLFTNSFGQNNASDLFISEYCEYNQTATSPQYFNHYIEIYNGTGDTVDLAQYQLWRSFNANGWNNNAGTPVTPVNLVGKLATNQTYVITRPNTESNPISIGSHSDLTCTYLNISGDDAIALVKDDGTGNYVIIDLIGDPNVDPGEYWSVAGIANGTQNVTISRKETICGPNTDWTVSAGTTAENSEWIVKAQNDTSDLDKHNSNCTGIAEEDTNQNDLFISEYCEYNQTVSTPQYFNHYIEIFNATGDSVDLTKYQLWRSFNANGWNNNAGTPVTPINLIGKLANGKTYVITRPNTESNPISIEQYSNQTCPYLNISGDDAIALVKDDGTGNYVIIDLIGSPTVDPGEYWSVAGVTNGTQNITIIRKDTVCKPNTDWALSAGTNSENSEWIVKTQNDITDIGKHTSECAGIVVEDSLVYTYDTITALFLGNSYTYYFDLPGLIDNLANTTGDKLIHYENTPGGWSLEQHYTTPASLSALKARFYDYVVLQDQSQRPALDIETVEQQTFKYATLLDSIRRIYSPCGQTVFYMTWGRKNGDANNCATLPDVCTYNGMDSLLNLRYRMMRDQNEALISPVGALRHYLRDSYPDLELYDPDGSHPSAAGSYAAACCFYSVLFKKDPAKCTFDFTINADTAQLIREAAKLIVFDSIDKWNSYRNCGSDSIEISILSPVDTNNFTEGVNFTAEAAASTTNGSISEVVFYLNGELKNTDTEAPYKVDLSSTIIGTNNIIVKVLNSEGNMNAARVNFKIKKAEIISDNNQPRVNNYKIYPNPAEGNLHIDLNESFVNSDLRIVSVTGQVIKKQIVNPGINSIALNEVNPGIYTLIIINGKDVVTENFIKK